MCMYVTGRHAHVEQMSPSYSQSEKKKKERCPWSIRIWGQGCLALKKFLLSFLDKHDLTPPPFNKTLPLTALISCWYYTEQVFSRSAHETQQLLSVHRHRRHNPWFTAQYRRYVLVTYSPYNYEHCITRTSVYTYHTQTSNCLTRSWSVLVTYNPITCNLKTGETTAYMPHTIIWLPRKLTCTYHIQSSPLFNTNVVKYNPLAQCLTFRNWNVFPTENYLGDKPRTNCDSAWQHSCACWKRFAAIWHLASTLSVSLLQAYRWTGQQARIRMLLLPEFWHSSF